MDADRIFRVLVARLSSHRDTADSFTHKLLYQLLARIDGVFPDLSWLPPPADAEIFDRDHVPWLCGATSKCGAVDFNVVAISLSIVQELLNVPVMLEKSAIPLKKSERLAQPSLPLVLLGGASALYTSALFCDDPPVDGLFIGDDVPTISRLFRTCKELHESGAEKTWILDKLAEIPGFILPDKKLRTKIFHSAELPAEQLLEQAPILWTEDGPGSGNLQISEGCACFCSFCAEGFGRKPYREFDAATLHTAALRQKAFMGLDNIELYSFNFSMHHDFYAILHDLSTIFPSIGLKSQRFDAFAQDPGMIKYLHALDKSSITCGLEGISGRLRRYLHKSLDQNDLQKSLATILVSPIRELKIFLVATGLEQNDDFLEFAEFLSNMQAILRNANRQPRIIFSMTILVRFPKTPLEFEDAPSPEQCKSILRQTEQVVHKAGFEFRASAGQADYWLSQILVRASDSRILAAVRKAQIQTGFVYYRDIPAAFFSVIKSVLISDGIDPAGLLKGHSVQDQKNKPWYALDTGVDEKFLIAQWNSARVFSDNGYCAGRRGRDGICLTCGACPDAATKKRINRRPDSARITVEKLRQKLLEAKKNEYGIGFRIEIGEQMRGIPKKGVGVILARALMLADERLVAGYRGFGGSLSFDSFGSNWLVGADKFILKFNGAAGRLVSELIQDPAFIAKINAAAAGFIRLIGSEVSRAIISAITFECSYQFDPARYFRSKSLKCTLRRESSGNARYELTRDSVKKKILAFCVCEYGDENVRVTVVPGQKFNPEEFVRLAFVLPADSDWVRVRMVAKSG